MVRIKRSGPAAAAGRQAVLTLLLILCSMTCHATQTDNHGIYAVPAPGKVAIDGRLDDWDLSGQVLMCYDLETLRDVYSGQVAMMYDADNLYAAIRWKCPLALRNHHDPRYQGDKGWAGDCVQLRIRTDRIAHVTAWDFIDKNEPAVNIAYGSDADPIGPASHNIYRTKGWEMEDGVAMAFAKDADGKGYVQEIRLPWRLLVKSRTYRPGDHFNCGVELLWGGADWPEMRYADNLMPGKTSREFFWTAYDAWGPVFLAPKGHLKLPPPWSAAKSAKPAAPHGPVPIVYMLPQAARVTLALNDAAGNRVRNLIPAQPRAKGRNIDYWDGLDDAGRPVPPGRYTYKAIYHDPIRATWAMSFANPGDPSWTTSDGRGSFYGDHGSPLAAAAAGNYVGLACSIGEAGPPLIGCDLEGRRLWGQANRVFGKFGIQALATDGKVLWVGSDGSPPVIYRVEIATGLYAPWKRKQKDAEGREFNVLDLPIGEAVQPTADHTEGDASSPNLTAVAYRDGALAVCLSRRNQVRILDADTGELRRTLSVPEPKSAVLDADGAVIVLSQGKLLRFSADASSASFAAETFPDGYGLAMDSARNVYLSVRGADQNVKVFSPGGRLLREIGARGGRPASGSYNPNGMLNPAQIAIDGRGRLWVTEENDNPKRTSVWDAASGALVKDLAGSTHYAAAGALDPLNPEMGFNDGTVYALNWRNGSCRPVYSLARRPTADDLFPPEVMNITNRVVHHNADVYVYTTEGWLSIAKCVLLRDGAWRSAAAVGMVLDPAELRRNIYAAPSLAVRFSHPVFSGHIGEAFAWADKNGDGLVQPDEITFAPIVVAGKRVRLHTTGWGLLPAPDGTLPYFSPETQTIIKLHIAGYTEVGAPIYDVTHPEIIKVDRPLVQDSEGHAAGGANGVVYFNSDPLFAADARGHVLWTYPSNVVGVHGSHNAKAARPGYLIGPNSVLGTVDMGAAIGEVFDMNGNMGEHYLFTGDGLWIQALFKDTRGGFTTPDHAVRGMPMDEITAGGESFGGNFVRTRDGKTYLTIGGTDARVLEVHGLESIRRFGGALTYSPRQYAAAQTLLQKNAARAAEAKVYTIARAAAPPALDGKFGGWPELMDDARPLMDIQESSERRYARIQARWDDRCLYLAYRVFASADHMRNVGQDDRLLFKTGDVVDLMIGPEPQKGLRGDLRLLMTFKNGRPFAVINQKEAPGAPASERYTFSVSWHSVAFGRVEPTTAVRMATGPAEGGYFVEAAIPWKVLGITPKSGMKLRGDVGVLFADNGGTTTVARQYWSNKATGLVNDVPGEADLTPELWGEFILQ